MISRIGIRNFKAFGDETIQTAPLTLLCGVNGAGKSSFLQVLRLLGKYASTEKKTVEVPLYKPPLLFGCQRDIQNRFSPDESSIQFSVADDESSETYKATLKLTNSDKDTIEMEQTLLSADSSVEDGPGGSRLLDALRRMHYMSATRQPASQEHWYSSACSSAREFGEGGEYAVGYLEDHKDDPIALPGVCADDRAALPLLGNQVDAWLKEVSPGVSVKTSKDEKKNRAYLSVVYSGFEFRPQNVGLGVSYVLPLLVLILSAKKGDLILIENPEAHIHPSGQAAFGKLMLRAAKSGVQIFVETHSDHIINGVRVAVKAGGREFAETASVVFFTREVNRSPGELPSEFAKPKSFAIDENGECGDYPPGFLDEWTIQLTELL